MSEFTRRRVDVPVPLTPGQHAQIQANLDVLFPADDRALWALFEEIMDARLRQSNVALAPRTAVPDGACVLHLRRWLQGEVPLPTSRPLGLGEALFWTLAEVLGEEFTLDAQTAWRSVCTVLDAVEANDVHGDPAR
ncbi:hypothetical protein [Deinococcus yavapaiensis]|uniref:Uncharacterized protein n=1 Tax=Deinococcus yavapaiensis KR-236 TaxID=694435 RepID=A0A318SEQ7_9DEIO|nr:hypothetical protein [Deinococcus yavapaiensis]PYE55022.1 hypothetical protein DES52_104297 [Deinococcus yavapaiensis KR-236]